MLREATAVREALMQDTHDRAGEGRAHDAISVYGLVTYAPDRLCYPILV